MKKTFFYFFLIVWAANFAQTSRILQKTYTKQEGLDIDIISAMAFDNDGFLWLGGENISVRKIIISDKKLVLQRFNGNIFHNIPLPEYKNRILSVNQIYKRDDGKFYVTVFLESGSLVLLFDPYTSRFQKCNFSNFGNPIEAISQILKYKGKDYILIQKEGRITLCIINSISKVTPVLSFIPDTNKYMLDLSTRFIPFEDFCIISDDNFFPTAFDWKGNKLKNFTDVTFKNSNTVLKKTWIDEVFKNNDTVYFFNFNNPQLYFVDEKNVDILPVKGKANSVESDNLSTVNDAFNHNSIIAIKENKINFFEFNNGNLKTNFSETDFDAGRGIQVISNNLKNEIWIATGKRQLHQFKFPSQKIKTFLLNKGIRSLYKLNKKEYLVATEKEGWYKINIKSDIVKPYTLTEGKNNVLPNSSRNIIEGNNGLWSNDFGNIIKVDKDSQTLQKWRHFPVVCMEKLNDSIIVYGTNEYYLMSFNTNRKQHKSLLLTDSLYIYDLAVKKENPLIVAGTDKGLLTYNIETKKSEFYGKSKGLEDPFILMVDYTDENGYILGTRSGNVVSFDPKLEKFKTIYKDELKAGIATILYKDDTWWINTFNGIVAFNKLDSTTTRYSTKDGFSDNEANRYSALKTEEGLLVGTLNGLNYFNPDDLKPQENFSKLVLLKVKKYDSKENKVEEILDRNNFDTNKTITLSSENRALELDFSVTNGVSSSENTYKYRLNNENWINLNKQQFIRFPNLAAGNYLLEIEALDFSGKKIAESLFLNIDSKNFFYKTWWFYLIVSLTCILFLLWMLNQTRIRRKLQENFSHDLMQSQENERTRISRELHDSVGQQLTLIKKKAQNLQQDEITYLTHNALEEVREISRGLYPAFLKQLGLSESIEQLLYDLDEETDIFFSIEIENIDVYFNEEATLNIYRFIQECLTNIIKHAEAKAVSLKIKKQKNTVLIFIDDNGKGFDISDSIKQKSLGLKTISERIRILKGNILIESKPLKGTTIKAEVPIKNE